MQSQQMSGNEQSWTGYAPIDGVYDEMKAADGRIRPPWESCVDAFEGLGAAELQSRWEQGEREIAKNGISYNPHDQEQGLSRPWAFDPIPLTLDEDEWKRIRAGIRQRAALYELVLQDIYGPQKLLKDKILPPDVLFAHPRYYPAYHRSQSADATRLQLYAADLARSPNGRWWVTENRTHAPFGLGYVLENRVMSARFFPNIMRDAHIHRVAPFFAALRESLTELSPGNRENPRTVLWSMGPMSPTYFEDAYLARYLGYTLAEGADLAVRGNRVMLKTLGGLLPVDVLFRRLDDHDCDSVELRSDSPYSIPGLLEVMRSGGVGVANGLGSSLLEAPIIRAFEPVLSRLLLGEELILPTVATWWCGDAKALTYVLEHLNELLVSTAFEGIDTAGIRPARLKQVEKEALIARIKENPEKFVAQETVARSSTPVWEKSGPVPWRLALRSFAAKSKDDYCVLHGGLARVSPDPLRLDVAMTSGDRSQDVWIRTSGAVEETTLLQPPGTTIELKRSGRDLPSRVCDNLFWLGRKVERIESAVRLHRLATRASTSEYDAELLTRFLARALNSRNAVPGDAIAEDRPVSLSELQTRLEGSLLDPASTSSLPNMVADAMRLTYTVRDRIAVEMWRSVQRISQESTHLKNNWGRGDTVRLGHLDTLLSGLNGFSGLAAESMTRADGWRFLDLGRRIERALQGCQLLDATLTKPGDDESVSLELLLEIADSIMTYRNRYLATLQPAPVLDLLLTDESNPRSIGFQLNGIMEHITQLPADENRALRSVDSRIALSMQSTLRLAQVYELALVNRNGSREKLHRMLAKTGRQLLDLSDAISGQYLVHAGLPRHFGSV